MYVVGFLFFPFFSECVTLVNIYLVFHQDCLLSVDFRLNSNVKAFYLKIKKQIIILTGLVEIANDKHNNIDNDEYLRFVILFIRKVYIRDVSPPPPFNKPKADS